MKIMSQHGAIIRYLLEMLGESILVPGKGLKNSIYAWKISFLTLEFLHLFLIAMTTCLCKVLVEV
jgi:hypothetical protein